MSGDERAAEELERAAKRFLERARAEHDKADRINLGYNRSWLTGRGYAFTDAANSLRQRARRLRQGGAR